MKSIVGRSRPNDRYGPNTVQSDVLYVAEHSIWGQLGYDAVLETFPSARAILWSSGMPTPDLNTWSGDWIVSFKSDLLLSAHVLSRAKRGAVNFHPSPPKYRGLGGYWWALQNGDEQFGVTAHHMNERIDHGAIISTEIFEISDAETEESLKYRAAMKSLDLLNRTLKAMPSGDPLAPCGVQWSSHLYTSKELKLAQAVAPSIRRPIAA